MSSDATMCVWGVRPCLTKYRYICLQRFINIEIGTATSNYDVGLSACVVQAGHMKGIRPEADKNKTAWFMIQLKNFFYRALVKMKENKGEDLFLFTKEEIEDTKQQKIIGSKL
jgi:hypothetical protein